MNANYYRYRPRTIILLLRLANWHIWATKVVKSNILEGGGEWKSSQSGLALLPKPLRATLRDVEGDQAAYGAVRAAFEEHSVRAFRGQDVTNEGQLAFSRFSARRRNTTKVRPNQRGEMKFREF